MRQNVRERRFWERFASTSRNSDMFQNARMKVANSFAEIQCITSLTLKFLNNARSQTKRNAIFKTKKKMTIFVLVEKYTVVKYADKQRKIV